MHKFHKNTVYYHNRISSFKRLLKLTLISLDQLQAKITLSLEFALLWVKEM